jgi:hypothetical protein
MTALDVRKFPSRNRQLSILIRLTILAVGTLVFTQPALAAVVFALTDNNRLLRFDSATPGVLTGVAPISGRVGGEDLIGIDFRPANNLLYAVGEFGRVYTIDLNTAAATQVGTLAADPADPTNPYTQLFGSRWGFDFNPQADRLRITSDTRQNLRVNPTGWLVTTDGTITYAAGPNQNESPILVGDAYTNNFPGAASTTLFGIDAAATGHRLVSFVGSPNDGIIQAVGPLGVTNSSLVGFDILTEGQTNSAFAAFQDESLGVSQFFTVNLSTGAATLVGTIGGGDLIDGIAVVIPEPTCLMFLGLAGAGLLRRR